MPTLIENPEHLVPGGSPTTPWHDTYGSASWSQVFSRRSPFLKGLQFLIHFDQISSDEDGFAVYHCTICKARYHLLAKETKMFTWHKMRFCIGLGRDVLTVFLALQILVAIFGALAALVDTKQMFDVLPMHPIPFYYCLGLFILFVLVGLFMLIVYCLIKSEDVNLMARIRSSCPWWGFLISFPSFLWVFFAMFICAAAMVGMFAVLYILVLEIKSSWETHEGILREEELKDYVEEVYGHCAPPPGMAHQYGGH